MKDDLISRQAAIKAIENMQDCYNGFSDTYDKACIIGALEEVPSAQPNLQPTCNQLATDCISRQALRSEMYHEAFEKDSNEQRWDSGCWIRYKMFERIVDRQPSAQRTGRWIIKENPGTEWYRVTCSACGEDVSSVIPTIGFFPNVKALWDFCPNCGCAMKGEEE